MRSTPASPLVSPNTLENLTLLGTAAIDGNGNNEDNIIIGNGAANVLRGGYGDDTLTGRQRR